MRTFATTLLLLLAFAVPAGAAGWDRVNAPATSGKAHVYRAAAAFGEQGVWAAGYTYGFIGGAIEFRTLIQRWNGHGWWRAPTPDRETAPARNLLFDISAPGPARAWAVGSSAAGIGNPATRPLVLQWNSARWSIVDSPAGFTGALTAVAAARNGTVWIGGEGRNLQTLYAIPSTFLRDGSGWREVPFPNVPGCSTSSNGQMTRAELTDIASRGLRATWATGYCAAPGGERGFVVRFNGFRWIPVVTPDALQSYGPRGQMTGVSMAPDGEVWAVGWSDDFGVRSRPVAFLSSRGSVQPVAAPGQGSGAALYAVAAERGGAAVASGAFTQRSDSAPHPHLMGADGVGGLAIEPADAAQVGNLYGVALSPNGTAWAVGVSSWDDRGLILKRSP